MKDAINIGMVGHGRVAKRFIQAIKQTKLINLYGICGRSMKSLNMFMKSEDVDVCLYDDFDEMLSVAEIDAILICTPDGYHYEYAKRSINSGKHILVEKPICLEVSEASELVILAERMGVVAGVGYHLRWHPGLRKIVELVQSGDFGSIQHVSINWAHRFIDEAKWRKSPLDSKWWSLSTLGTHSLDIVRWIMREKCGEVCRIKKLETNKLFQGNDETSLLTLIFESGASASIYSSILHNSHFTIDVYGESCIIRGESVVGSNDNGRVTIDGQSVVFEPVKNLYLLEMENFANSILGIETIEVSLAEGMRNIEILSEKE